MRPRTLITLAAALAFVAFLLWSTLAGQQASCEVCVSFNGAEQCASASHASDAEALRSAQATACGPLTAGMDEIIACENRPPVRSQCQSR